ncbi:MAG: type II CRISPR-associated endonuclease Cas1 [Opitutales bacterium]|nr:type II CRISPR-associated endonuclease Cas1 [Opitutales bacterium]
MATRRIVEIAEDGRVLGVERGFLTVSSKGEILGKIPLDDIEAVLCISNYCLFTSSLASALAENSIPLLVCDKIKKYPKSALLAIESNYRQGDIIQAQADATEPMKKSAWAQIVRAKLRRQAQVLKFLKKDEGAIFLNGVAELVKSGDSENCEARGAARYWKELMGDYFKRDRNANDENIFFNYGYTVLRAATIRAILCAGLHPSLSLHHKSSTNSLRLADDLIEPFRPFVDISVKELLKEKNDLDAEAKKMLVSILNRRIAIKEKDTTLQSQMNSLAKNLAQFFLKESEFKKIPEIKIGEFLKNART